MKLKLGFSFSIHKRISSKFEQICEKLMHVQYT
jgi:hypothetical protein